MQGNTALELRARAEDSGNPGRDKFVYSTLDTSRDGMRLVILQPITEQGIAVRCQLEHVTFGEMPKYEALSYTWGDDIADREIELNGNTFLVRENLWKALLQLRLRDRERSLWIDAICINQDDILERNQQVRIMPHIYSRAQTVLAWLGSAGQHIEDFGDLCEMMCGADYWHRVWIVQEIGKARRIKVHCGPATVDWEIFINKIRDTPTLKDSVPLKLANQMKDKYGDGYKLENLLKTHQNALCKDVRDKIYGFTGLAKDTYGRLVMDYGKTPFQIWEDVVRFRNADKTIPQHDIFQFASFVRDLLGGHSIATDPKINTWEDEAIYGISEDSTGSTVLCPAKLWGRISCVGPSFSEMRSNLLQVDRWKDSIRLHVFDRHLRSAREESDLMLELLEDIDPSDLKVVRFIKGKTSPTNYPEWGRSINIMDDVKPKASHSKCYGCPFGSNRNETSLAAHFLESYFVLLDICPREGSDDEEVSNSFAGIALAPPYAREGDFICYFYQNSTAALIRSRPVTRKKKHVSGVIGTSIVPDVRTMVASKNKSEGEVKTMFAVLNNAPLKDHETINIRLDFQTFFQWLE